MAVTDIVAVPDVKDFLNITSSTFDGRLALFLSTASTMIQNRIGPVAGSPAYDVWYDGGETQILLRHTPVQSITAINESYGGSLAFALTEQIVDLPSSAGGLYGYSLNKSSGVLTRRVSGVAVPFAWGTLNIHITYVGGYAVAPADLQLATLLLVQHMWAVERGGSKRPGQGGDDTAGGGKDSDAWPQRVEEILENYYIPGIA